MNIELDLTEANGMVYHLEARREIGMNEETLRGLRKLKKAIAEAMPLLEGQRHDPAPGGCRVREGR